MYKITCPNCDHDFTANFDEEGYCECPSCQITLALGQSIAGGFEFVTNFEECVLEAHLLFEEAKNLDDSSLEDEIAYEVTSNDYMKGTFGLFSEMDAVGYMVFDTRKKAEGVYVLMHSNKLYGLEN